MCEDMARNAGTANLQVFIFDMSKSARDFRTKRSELTRYVIFDDVNKELRTALESQRVEYDQQRVVRCEW